MIFHVLIVDDEEDVLDSLVPGLLTDLSRRLASDPEVQKANQAAGAPLPGSGRVNLRVSAIGYNSTKVGKFAVHQPVHVHLHLCCEKGGGFRHALRLLKEQFFAVVVSDLRFADDQAGWRAGRYFIEDVQRRNPETFGILYSAYPKPDGFPAERFIRKGSAANLGGEELLAKIIEGFRSYLSRPSVQRLCRELLRRGLVYQSDAFGAVLRRLYDLADLYFGAEPAAEPGQRRPRPTLLIDGETGTGKTELAGLLHQLSQRAAEPLVFATCSQLADETFLRSTLFGHVKGSFSGATADRPGLVEAAGGGILLLDDLHKLGDASSVILHSFLDDGAYCHLGEDEVRRMSAAAIVCTVETPRWEEIKTADVLSESFIYRVEQLVLKLPPLRARPEDIERQAHYYTALYCQQIGGAMELSPGAVAWLVDFGFPGGNSRKLRDFLKGTVAAFARVTDYLDVAELEEYGSETGLLEKGRATANAAPAASAPVATEADGGWAARMVRLAAKALADECALAAPQADELCEKLFSQQFPRLWEEYRRLAQMPDPKRPIEIKLFDELFRYFAVYRAGSPAKAAKELGMKDNALREFIYSREQKRA